jgi:hypothetical protein
VPSGPVVYVPASAYVTFSVSVVTSTVAFATVSFAVPFVTVTVTPSSCPTSTLGDAADDVAPIAGAATETTISAASINARVPWFIRRYPTAGFHLVVGYPRPDFRRVNAIFPSINSLRADYLR